MAEEEDEFDSEDIECVSESESSDSWETLETGSDSDSPSSLKLSTQHREKPSIAHSRFAKPSYPPDVCKRIHRRLVAKCPFPVSLRSVNHIWKGHGNYQNALKESKSKKRKKKLPSYFLNSIALVKSIYRTSSNPNWTRLAKNVSRKASNSKNAKKKKRKRNRRRGAENGNRNDKEQKEEIQRTFYMKKFTKWIGFCGEGYSKTAHKSGPECDCCAVLVENGKRGLVTAYPVIHIDATEVGYGNKTHFSDESSSIDTDIDSQDNDYSVVSNTKYSANSNSWVTLSSSTSNNHI